MSLISFRSKFMNQENCVFVDILICVHPLYFRFKYWLERHKGQDFNFSWLFNYFSHPCVQVSLLKIGLVCFEIKGLKVQACILWYIVLHTHQGSGSSPRNSYYICSYTCTEGLIQTWISREWKLVTATLMFWSTYSSIFFYFSVDNILCVYS